MSGQDRWIRREEARLRRESEQLSREARWFADRVSSGVHTSGDLSGLSRRFMKVLSLSERLCGIKESEERRNYE
jgi:hypothetical protein